MPGIQKREGIGADVDDLVSEEQRRIADLDNSLKAKRTTEADGVHLYSAPSERVHLPGDLPEVTVIRRWTAGAVGTGSNCGKTFLSSRARAALEGSFNPGFGAWM